MDGVDVRGPTVRLNLMPNALGALREDHGAVGVSGLAAPRLARIEPASSGTPIGGARRADLPGSALPPSSAPGLGPLALVLSASTAGHVALLAWLLVGWQLDPEPLNIKVAEVTAVSQADYVRAVAAGLAPVAATPVEATERIAATSATLRLGNAPEELAAVAAEPVTAQSVRPVASDRVAAQPVERVARAARMSASPVDPIEPRAIPVQPAPPTQTVDRAVPEELRPTWVEAAPRPPKRPPGLTSKPEPQPDPQPEPDPQVAEAPPAQDSSEVEAREGSQDGQVDGTTTRQAEAAQPEAQASAAGASYPAQVMQRLSRTRRDRIRQSGTAVVAFTVSEDGGLATLGVAQSSGVAEIDQAGLALVQRASPFPPPPPGAQRNFSFQFTGN